MKSRIFSLFKSKSTKPRSAIWLCNFPQFKFNTYDVGEERKEWIVAIGFLYLASYYTV